MASISIIGIPYWGKPIFTAARRPRTVSVPRRRSESAFFFSREVAGLAGATGPRAWWGMLRFSAFSERTTCHFRVGTALRRSERFLGHRAKDAFAVACAHARACM